MKFYSAAIGNFMVQHMPTGGVYLVGNLTNFISPKFKEMDILKDWKERHPEMKKIVDEIPLVLCNEVDLGLRGAGYVARKLYNKHHPSIP
jgi:glucokinase